MGEIKAVALDVDGVLTDGTFCWSSDGSESKRFSFMDVMGVSLGRKAGLIFALISGENSPLVGRYAQKMGIGDIYQGCKDKAAALREFAAKHGLEMTEVCLMGDDINDVPAMELAGFSAAPPSAHESALSVAQYITKHPGGNGAVRELIDAILARRRTPTG
jgi:3-deoxy-D-manno-octulosonate 8-phosphate phosphatase (KDO 8-P phosphatase)